MGRLVALRWTLVGPDGFGVGGVLMPGEVAVWTGADAPRAGTDQVSVYSGSCDRVGTQIDWIAVAPSWPFRSVKSWTACVCVWW